MQAAGKTQEAIRGELARAHGVSVTRQAISQFLDRAGLVSGKRAATANETMIVERRALELGKVADSFRRKKDWPKYFKAVELERRALDLLAKVTTAPPPVDQRDGAVAARVLEKIRSLVEPDDAGTETEGPVQGHRLQ